MIKAVKLVEKWGFRYVAIPQIGAGLGGLELQDVKQVLIEIAAQTPVDIRVVEKYVKDKPMEKI